MTPAGGPHVCVAIGNVHQSLFLRCFGFKWRILDVTPAGGPHVVEYVHCIDRGDRSSKGVGVWVPRKGFEEPGIVASVKDHPVIVVSILSDAISSN